VLYFVPSVEIITAMFFSIRRHRLIDRSTRSSCRSWKMRQTVTRGISQNSIALGLPYVERKAHPNFKFFALAVGYREHSKMELFQRVEVQYNQMHANIVFLSPTTYSRTLLTHPSARMRGSITLGRSHRSIRRSRQPTTHYSRRIVGILGKYPGSGGGEIP
jgi:hypothetical protein